MGRAAARVGILLAIVGALAACATPPAAVTMSDALPVDQATTASIYVATDAAPEPMDLVGSIVPDPATVPALAPASTATAAPLIAPQPPPPEYTPIPPIAQACCKVCRAGKACGDTCISRSNTCHVGRGCACDG